MTAQRTRTLRLNLCRNRFFRYQKSFVQSLTVQGLCRMGKRFKPLNPLPTLFAHNFKRFLLTMMFPCSSAQKF